MPPAAAFPSPAQVTHGHSVKGPVYAGSTRPPVELTSVSSSREPGLGVTGVTFTATAKIRGLVAGQAYNLHMITDLASVPTSPTAAVTGAASIKSFTPTGTTHSLAVSFESAVPAYFIATPA